MNARILWVLIGISLGASLVTRVAAGDCENNPSCYADPRAFLERLEQLQKNPHITRKDLDDLSAQIHHVSVLNTPTPRSDIVPAATRPAGTVKLKAVLKVEPATP